MTDDDVGELTSERLVGLMPFGSGIPSVKFGNLGGKLTVVGHETTRWRLCVGAQALFEIFFPVPPKTDPGQTMATKKDLQNTVSKLKIFIEETTFTTELGTHSDTMMVVNEQVRSVWMQNAATDSSGHLTPRSKRRPPVHRAIQQQPD